MSKTISKISAIGLSLTTAVWLSGAAMVLPVASAATIEELQAQIASLLSQIAALQAQLSSAQGTTGGTTYNFTRDLTLGSKGDDVKALQQFLNGKGYTLASSGAGSPGSETTYFGSLTRAALAKYQAAVGISPSVGYFGPITRTYLASLAGGTTDGGVIVPSGETLAVAIASDSPSARTIGSGTAFNPALKVTLTAGSKEVQITSLTVKKSGFIANTNLNGVEIIDSKGVRHGQVVTSINADETILIPMSTEPIVISAGTSEKITIRFNLLSGNYTGTVNFGILSATAIVSNAGSVSGSFPIAGATMNIVYGGSALASSTLDVLTSTGSSTLNVDPDSLQEITKFRVQEVSSNEGVYLHSLTLYNYENGADADFKDVTLEAQDGTSLAVAQPSNKYVTFTLSSPYFIDKGQTKDFTVKAKLVSGTTRKINLTVYNNYDIDLRGASTGVSVLPGAGTNDTTFPLGNGFNIQTIGSGSMTLTRATDSPSSSITPGATNVVLAKYEVKPTGENYELRQVSFYIATSSSGSNHLSGTVYVKVNNTTVYSTGYSSVDTESATTYTLSTYPILTAGQTSTIEVVASISTSAVADETYTVTNLDIIQAKRLVTNDLVDPGVSAVSGHAISVKAAQLVVTTLATPVAASVVRGTNDYEFATFQLNAQSGGEDVKVSKIRITHEGGTSTLNSNINNYRLYKDNESSPLTTSGSTATFSSPDGVGDTLDFNLVTPITVTQSTPVTLHLKANVLSGAVYGSNATSSFRIASTTSAYTAVGAVTGNTVVAGGSNNTITGNGQTMTTVSAGTLTMSLVSGSGASPSANQVMSVGTTNATVFAFKMTSQYETQKITSLTITATSSGGALATTTLTNLALYEGASLRKTASQFNGCGPSHCWVTFTDSDNILSAPVPFTGVTLYLKADVSAGGTAALGNDFKFKINATSDVSIKGSASALTSGTKTGTPAASGITYVVPQNVTVEAVSPLSATTIGLSSGNTIGIFKITNNGTAPIYLASSTAFTFTNGGSATSYLTFGLYSSAMGGTSADSSVTYIATSTAAGASSSVPFNLSVQVTSANRKIDGGSWRYLTVKNTNGPTTNTTGVPANNDTFQFSVSALGNLLYSVDEADLGYSGNPQSDNDLSDTVADLYIEGTPSVATVTAKS